MAGPPRHERVAIVREMITDGRSKAEIVEWCMIELPAPEGLAADALAALPRQFHAKTWKATRPVALRLIEDAQIQMIRADSLPKETKRAERRAVYEKLLGRSMARNSGQGDLLATKINDMLCRIDGAYEPSVIHHQVTAPLTIEDAIEVFNHTKATFELAQSRGALTDGGEPDLADMTAEDDVDEVEDTEDIIDVKESVGPAN